MKINLNNINKQQLYMYIFSLVGFFMFSFYIWVRFIRTRLPREIPYTLTLVSFFILICIITSLIYILYRMLRPKVPSQIILEILQYLRLNLRPLEILDNLLKQKGRLQYKIIFIFSYFIEKYNLFKDIINYKFYFYLNIIPQIIILFSFIFDIFYMRKIEYFYYILLLNLIPLAYVTNKKFFNKL